MVSSSVRPGEHPHGQLLLVGGQRAPRRDVVGHRHLLRQPEIAGQPVPDLGVLLVLQPVPVDRRNAVDQLHSFGHQNPTSPGRIVDVAQAHKHYPWGATRRRNTRACVCVSRAASVNPARRPSKSLPQPGLNMYHLVHVYRRQYRDRRPGTVGVGRLQRRRALARMDRLGHLAGRARRGHFAVGKRFAIKQPGMSKLDWKVTEIDPGLSWTWVQRSPGVNVSARHHVIAQPGGRTLVRQQLDQRGRAWRPGRADDGQEDQALPRARSPGTQGPVRAAAPRRWRALLTRAAPTTAGETRRRVRRRRHRRPLAA